MWYQQQESFSIIQWKTNKKVVTKIIALNDWANEISKLVDSVQCISTKQWGSQSSTSSLSMNEVALSPNFQHIISRSAAGHVEQKMARLSESFRDHHSYPWFLVRKAVEMVGRAMFLDMPHRGVYFSYHTRCELQYSEVSGRTNTQPNCYSQESNQYARWSDPSVYRRP